MGFINIIVLLTGMIAFLPGQMARADELKLDSRMDKVTVFPAGARIERLAPLKMAAGEHIAIIGGLPASLDESSIRVEGKGSEPFEIVSVDSKKIFAGVKPGENLPDNEERRRLEKQIEQLKDRSRLIEEKIKAAQARIRLMDNLADLPNHISEPGRANAPGGPFISVENWVSIADLIGNGREAAGTAILQARIEQRKIAKEIEKLEKRLSMQPPKKERQVELRVALAASKPLAGQLRIIYQIGGASWQPFYDARLSTGKSKEGKPQLILTRRAAVRQWSGEDWSNVALSLSTTRPRQGSQAPQLRTRVLDLAPPAEIYRAPRKMPRFGEKRALRPASPPVAMDLAKPPMIASAGHRAQERRAQVRKYDFQAVFDIPGQVSIKSNGEAKKLAIGSLNYEPALKLRAVPALKPQAYLYATFRHRAGEAPLLPGKVALYRNGVFAGNGKLPLVNGGDKYEMGFGVDEVIKVSRHEIRHKKGEEGIFTTSNVDERRYLIRIVNLHQHPMDMEVIGRIPYALNKEIEVSLLSSATPPSRRNVKNRRGILAWDFRLAGGGEKKIHLDYRISWPKGKRLTGR